MNTKNTQKETTKKASAPETRITVAEIREAGGKFHIYTLPGGFYHCTCVNREDAEEVMAERFPPATGEGNAPRVADLNASALLSGANPSEGKLIDELALANLQKEQNWEAYQEALRLLDKAAAQRDELVAALKAFLAVVGRIGIKSQDGEILIASGRLTAQEAAQFSDGFIKLNKLANTEGRAQ